MDTTFILEIIKAVWRELITWRSWVVGVFIVVSIAVLIVGMFWPARYETSTMLYADVTNIIAPLLKGRAEVTKIDRSGQARELIYTRKIMLKVASQIGLVDQNSSVGQQETIIKILRKRIKIKNEGKNYFSVSYHNKNQDLSFEILNAVVSAFIADTSDKRRQESRSAYEFIEQQVVSYKRQLLLAEKELKEFKSKNLDGNEHSVRARIGELRLQIEELKLTIDETEARDLSLKEQLKNESAYLDAKGKVDEEKYRLNSLKVHLDTLRLSYQETYPDIISLKQQISSQQLIIDAMQGGAYVPRSSSSESVENPLYEELRKNQAKSEVDLRSQNKRLEAMGRMLEGEYKRAERVASKEAEMSELTRDYDVTREIYEEMLGRKEKARLSMALDIEGQGVSFKIQEPAVYPLNPSGVRFVHFVLIAPLVGLLVSIGLIAVYVLLDPRVRSPSMLATSLPANIELLAVVPHVNTALGQRLLRSDMIMVGFVLLLAIGIYIGLVWIRLSGLI